MPFRFVSIVSFLHLLSRISQKIASDIVIPYPMHKNKTTAPNQGDGFIVLSRHLGSEFGLRFAQCFFFVSFKTLCKCFGLTAGQIGGVTNEVRAAASRQP